MKEIWLLGGILVGWFIGSCGAPLILDWWENYKYKKISEEVRREYKARFPGIFK